MSQALGPRFTPPTALIRAFMDRAASLPQAVAYMDRYRLGRSVTVKLAHIIGSTWSALNEAAFTVGELGLPLRITEIMYDPMVVTLTSSSSCRTLASRHSNLGGITISKASRSLSIGYTIAPGQRIVLASGANTNAFLARYPGW
jgi:hypothetical protein